MGSLVKALVAMVFFYQHDSIKRVLGLSESPLVDFQLISGLTAPLAGQRWRLAERPASCLARMPGHIRQPKP